ncbi:hypothetical protein [Pseudoalteromonas ruthenica]|uniref:hypothetical protein n=1 Tax=Pseudoalteromonas ruthenica TaxID=151081 RepID=UPI00241DBA83|nr:hypothetical protein [Pseudoalteromonas ruthenica]
MSQLTRKKQFATRAVITRALYTGALFIYVLFFINFMMEQSFWAQAISVLIFSFMLSAQYQWSIEPIRSSAIFVEHGVLNLLDTPIKLADVKEVIYCQHQRYEHIVRFRYHNKTFQDFELSSSDLIADLQLYHFLVAQGLVVRMTEDSSQFS